MQSEFTWICLQFRSLPWTTVFKNSIYSALLVFWTSDTNCLTILIVTELHSSGLFVNMAVTVAASWILWMCSKNNLISLWRIRWFSWFWWQKRRRKICANEVISRIRRSVSEVSRDIWRKPRTSFCASKLRSSRCCDNSSPFLSRDSSASIHRIRISLSNMF